MPERVERTFQIPDHPDLKIEIEGTADRLVLRPNTSEIVLNAAGAMVFCQAIMDILTMTQSVGHWTRLEAGFEGCPKCNIGRGVVRDENQGPPYYWSNYWVQCTKSECQARTKIYDGRPNERRDDGKYGADAAAADWEKGILHEG